MSSIISNIVGIAEKITSVPQQIADKLGLGALFSALSEKVVAVRDTLGNIPSIIRDHIKDIFSNMIDAVLSIPSKIKDLRDDMVQKLKDIIEGILNLPEKIKDAIKALFLPSDGFIEGKVQHFRDKLLGMGIDTYDMGSIFNKEQPFEDITCTIRGQTVTIVRMDVVDKVVKKFRPTIRGFMWLMLVIYNYNQFMGFIGQNTMTLGGMLRSVKGKGDTD